MLILFLQTPQTCLVKSMLKCFALNMVGGTIILSTPTMAKSFSIKSEVPRCEWKNQQFLLDRVGPRAAIRIPKIYAVFGEPHSLYLIMEFIQTDHIASDIQRARAISDIVSIEVPLDIGPGPFGGGRIHMKIFWNDQISDVDYPSIQDLEGYLNRVCTPEP